MTRLLKSSLKMSLTTRRVRSGSLYRRSGAVAVLAFFSMASHCAASLATSRDSSSSDAPSAAVRTITPAFSGMTCFRICLSRLRSVSGSLRLIPVMLAPGT
jgi:hypothetical protein